MGLKSKQRGFFFFQCNKLFQVFLKYLESVLFSCPKPRLVALRHGFAEGSHKLRRQLSLPVEVIQRKLDIFCLVVRQVASAAQLKEEVGSGFACKKVMRQFAERSDL